MRAGVGGQNGGVSHQGMEGPVLSSSRAIKSSQCRLEPQPRSPAGPRGRMKTGFHGYHTQEEKIRIKPESKVAL